MHSEHYLNIIGIVSGCLVRMGSKSQKESVYRIEREKKKKEEGEKGEEEKKEGVGEEKKEKGGGKGGEEKEGEEDEEREEGGKEVRHQSLWLNSNKTSKYP